MSYSNSFPTQRPSLNLVFNGGSDQLDSRISFSRADSTPSNVHYWSNEKHLSTLNLMTYSTAFDNSAWGTNNIPAPTTGQTDPSGGTGGCILIADTTNGSHNKFQSQVVSGDLCFTVYAKPASGTMRMMLNLYNTTNDWEVFLFDLVGGSPVAASGTSSTFSNVSATQTASGNGYYKCTIKATGSITSAIIALNPNATTSGLNAYGGISFAGDGTAGITVAFASLSTVGSSDYNATTTQIHREYSSTLKSVTTSGQPRFEYDPADGQSEGLLIESQATNLTKYSDDFSSWGGLSTVAVTSNAGVAPSGQLAADLLVSPSTAAAHYILDSTIAFTSGTTYTGSVYVKSAGHRYVQICGNTSAFGSSPYQWVNYDLEAGTLNANNCSGTITAVGNGYYRVTATMTATVTSTQSFIMMFADSLSSGFFPTTTGDDYSGFLAFGFQTEVGSSASSLISTSGAAATKSADSCSVVSAPLLDNGSGGLTVEYDMRNASTTSYALQTARSSGATNNDGATIFNEGLFINGSGTNTRIGNTTSNVFHKVAASWESGSQKISRDGSAVTEDTTTVVPQSGTDTLHIGTRQDGAASVNGHIRNIAIYSEPLTSTNLTTLSQL